MREKLLISACLLGENCKYSGGNNYEPLTEALGKIGRASCRERVYVLV